MKTQDIVCPVCGRTVRGYDYSIHPEERGGYFSLGDDFYVVSIQGFTWILIGEHGDDGVWCDGVGALCYVGDGNL